MGLACPVTQAVAPQARREWVDSVTLQLDCVYPNSRSPRLRSGWERLFQVRHKTMRFGREFVNGFGRGDVQGFVVQLAPRQICGLLRKDDRS